MTNPLLTALNAPTRYSVMRRRLGAGLIGLALAGAGAAAQADAVETLRAFAREVRTGKAQFSQTVTSPDGARKKTATGTFEFARPDRFRFVYSKPFEQTIVADGKKVWIYDVDLNQVSVRGMSAALGATPAALLAGSAVDKDFELSAAPDRDGLSWVLATPRAKEGSIRTLQIGFKGKTLAALEIVDAFGQRSLLLFSDVVANAPVADAGFRFTPPKGADVIEAP